MSVEWFDQFSGAMRQLRAVADEAADLSDAFAVTGNVVVAERLMGIANELTAIKRLSDDAIHTWIADESRAVNASIGATLTALFRGPEPEVDA